MHFNIDGSVQGCSDSIANALELLQSCTEPSICLLLNYSPVQASKFNRLSPAGFNNVRTFIELVTIFRTTQYDLSGQSPPDL